ncbi:MAG: hypothetical protein AAF928_00640 [Myxococcota bacterium]
MRRRRQTGAQRHRGLLGMTLLVASGLGCGGSQLAPVHCQSGEAGRTCTDANGYVRSSATDDGSTRPSRDDAPRRQIVPR